MCIPPSSNRNQQRHAQVRPRGGRARQNCPLPRLVRLTVAGATQLQGSEYGEVVDNDCVITVTATTEPDTPQVWANLNWSLGDANDQNNAVRVDRLAVGTRRLTVTLANGQEGSRTLHVDITLVDLTDLAFQLPVQLAGTRRWKAYESDGSARVIATTSPPQPNVYQQLRWDSGAAVMGQAQEHDVALRPARDAAITVTLGNVCEKSLVATVHICTWPALHIQRELFDSLDVLNDGVADFANLFDKMWIEGRPNPAVNTPAANCQSILWYTAGGTISVAPRFRVTTHPTDTESLYVAGQAAVGGVTMRWVSAAVDVAPGAGFVTVPQIAADMALPAGVRCEDAFTIDWYFTNQDNSAWINAGSTQHILYVGLQAPTENRAYWTLLDASCRNAVGQTTENGFVPAAFAALTGTTGDGNGLRRKGDGVRTSYYLQGVNTSGSQVEPSVYSTRGILSRPDGTGRCGGWADLMKHMLRLHGVTGYSLWLIRGADPNAADMTKRFLVKNCAFNGAGTSNAAPYTHLGDQTQNECVKQAGLAGQGKTNPEFDFGDHVVVWHNNIIYDPSYGVHGYADVLTYENAAIDGLGTAQRGMYQWAFAGTPQFIALDTSPGYVEHATDGGATWGEIAVQYGTNADTLEQAPENRGVLTFMNMYPTPVDGLVYVPRAIASAAGFSMLTGHWV
ncbi:MAG TPA: hypothetical protein VGG99_10085 [Acetobacteraceae bacterium]|jgi:hypothetical protein